MSNDSYKILVEILEGKEHFGDRDVDIGIILKLKFKRNMLCGMHSAGSVYGPVAGLMNTAVPLKATRNRLRCPAEKFSFSSSGHSFTEMV
jgi:hypothetical protein